MQLSYIKRVFNKLFSNNIVYRVSNIADLKFWKAYSGYKASESIWKRVPLSLIPSYCYHDPFFHTLDLKSEPEFDYRNVFVVEIDAEQLVSEGKLVYPCYYYSYVIQEIEKRVNRLYVHVEPVILMFEYEIFMMDDLQVEDIKTIYTEDDKVKSFFEEYGVKVRDYSKLDRQEFREAFKVAVILRKLYTMSLCNMKREQKLVQATDFYNLKLNDWLDKLGVPKVNIRQSIHVPSFKRLIEDFVHVESQS